mgnify:CR=1 FL=1
MNIKLVPTEATAKIKVLGIGGAGGNAINDMIKSEMAGVDFVAANSDAMSLDRNLAPIKIQLGPTVTRGLGAGGNPEIGREATREEADRIRHVEHCVLIDVAYKLPRHGRERRSLPR